MTEPAEFDWMLRARVAQSRWAKLTVRERCRSLRFLRHRIAERTLRIVDTLTNETGKMPLDALSGDILVTLEQLRYNEHHADRLLRTRRIAKPAIFNLGARFEETFEPYGVILVYSPSNYPIQLSVVPMATALVAGNAVILKCSEKTPQTARLIEDLYRSANLPEDLVQFISAEPESAGNLIAAGPDMVFFTGSSENGRKVAMRAAEHLIPALLELGGKDPCLVFADCNFQRAVEGIAYGAFSNAGQVCVGIKRLYVEASIFPAFLDALTQRARKLRIGPDRDCDLGTLPPGAARARFIAQVEDAINRGARQHLPQQDWLTGCEPVILSNVSSNSRLIVEETFGPVVCAAPFRDEMEAIAFANANAFALSCSIWTRDSTRAKRIAAQMTAGTCAVNDVIRNIANPYASFGGNFHSGYGRYHGPAGLVAFSRSKSVMIVHDRRQRELHWFPFKHQTFRLLQKVLAFRHLQLSLLRRFLNLFLPALSAAVLLSALASIAQAPARLHTGVILPQGSHINVAFFIFESKNGFPNIKSKALRGGFVAVPDTEAGDIRIDAGELSLGRYAVSPYQDVLYGPPHDRKALVWCPRNTCTKSSELLEDGIGGSGPDKGTQPVSSALLTFRLQNYR